MEPRPGANQEADALHLSIMLYLCIVICHELVNYITRGNVRHTFVETIQTSNTSGTEAIPLGVIDNDTFSSNWRSFFDSAIKAI